jgi:uncharacterized lipoprotein YmbA
MRFFFIASSVLALAACASNEPGPKVAAVAPAASGAQVAAEDKTVCHRVQAMGELTTHTVCEKQSDVNLRGQEALQEAAQRNQANHMHAVPSGGGS